MLSTCEGVSAAEGKEPAGSARQSSGHRGEQSREERLQGPGVQEWLDGSRYEGEFVNGLKHGKGRYTWVNGEFYEGFFYKDYKHGDGLYCWPTGHKFTGKFYLNRKEGYGRQMFPDGATFRGLYHADQKFGPGVVSDPDGCEDVGLWIGERLFKMCNPVEDGFSLKVVSGYATFLDRDFNTDSLTKVENEKDRLPEESFILPPEIEIYSTDGDHLPLPPGRRRELDEHFYGELWEPEAYPHQGYKRDPLSTLPLQTRMQVHIHKHRLQAKNVDWDVAAVLSLNRESFGPKGHLEASSKSLIQQASRGDLQAVLQILQTGLVHPDVADSQGHTALIAATVNCHNNVIHLLLDMGADIDKLNCEGMSALAVCHVLYYPFQSMHTPFAKPPKATQSVRSFSACGSGPKISQVDFTTNTVRINNRPQTTGTTLNNETNQSHLSEHRNIPNDPELMPELNEPATPADTKDLHKEESKGTEEDVQRGNQSRCDLRRGIYESEVKGIEREIWERNKDGEDSEVGESRETEGVEDVEEHLEQRVRNIHEDDVKEIEERGSEGTQSSQQWKQCQVEAAGRVQVLKLSTEPLSPIGIPQHSETQDVVCKRAPRKIQNRVRLNTLKLLLERGADPNACRVPMPVLFLAIMASDTEAVRRLLLCGARTDVPLPDEAEYFFFSYSRKGLYPLHVAVALPGPAGPKITELLLHAVADPDAQAADKDEIYGPDKDDKPLSTNENLLKGGGRTALHVACQRESDYRNASKIVALLLAHGASTDLLWSGHSPLSLAIASGNDLVVEELLKGGANPNLLLGRRVGSALCALLNFNYHLGGNRAKLLDILFKGGADILMQVKVGRVVGNAVDYAHYSFNQDLRIAHTPFHALNMRERETFKARRRLLSMIGDLLRQSACQRQREISEREQTLKLKRASVISTNGTARNCENLSPIKEKHRNPEFKFCYHCGRSVSVKLTACSLCHKVFYCSRNCKVKAWDQRHKQECSRESASADGIQRSVVFKSQGGPRPLTAVLKPKAVPRPLVVELKSQRHPELLSKAEVQINLKENYSHN
ncbi:ankyrin repeat and MYND domain-containing protein 1 [Labrus mixtus]|uniref:ankyrin repeat and MYND domain-containing protein 1 n=1 Tax=Labrus mixtus TaxID=508554 RepID=UPI0029C0122E|nr:ankyrin repeat and MYND domain-containing protein 1 [Labrus mixtus]